MLTKIRPNIQKVTRTIVDKTAIVRNDYRFKLVQSGVCAVPIAVIASPGIVVSTIAGMIPYEWLQTPITSLGNTLTVGIDPQARYKVLNRQYHRSKLQALRVRLPVTNGYISKATVFSGKNLGKLEKYEYFDAKKFKELPEECTIDDVLDVMQNEHTFKYYAMGVICTIVAVACVVKLWESRQNQVSYRIQINNIPSPSQHYQESHWSDELDQKIKVLEATIGAELPVVLAIFGTPGCGKTELSMDYARKHADGKSSIAWSIRADTSDNILDGYCKLAVELKVCTLGDVEEKKSNPVWFKQTHEKVNEILSKQHNWTLVFDNFDSGNVEQLSKFFPTSRGIILITTRNANLLENDDHRLDIGGGLKPSEATKLMFKLTNQPSDEYAFALAESLGYLPLHLLTASSVIRNSVHKWSYKQYYEHIKELSKSSTKKVDEEHALHMGQLDIRATQHAVMRDAISQLDEKCLEALIFCSYIYPKGITIDLFKDFIRMEDATLSDAEIDLKCDKLLFAIQNSSLLQQVSGQLPGQPVSYNIHAVTQDVCRELGISKEQANKILDTILAKLAPFDDMDRDIERNAASWRPRIPHIMMLVTHDELLQIANAVQVTSLLYYAGKSQEVLGHPQQVAEYFTRALPIAQKHYGDESWEVALLLSARGIAEEYHQAIKDLDHALCIARKCYGSESKQAALILNNLGLAHTDAGKSSDAKKVLDEALPLAKKYYGNTSRQVAIILNNLGRAYLGLKNPVEAKNTLKLAVETIESCPDFGSEHEELILMLSNLGVAYIRDNKPEKAVPELERALRIAEKCLCHDHQSIAIVLNTLGNAYMKLQSPRKARPILERSLLVMKNTYGENSWQAAVVTKTLATCYMDLGYRQYPPQEVKDLLEKACPIIAKHFGNPEHPTVVDAFAALARVNTILETVDEVEIFEAKASYLGVF